ncbi:VOC family protein [Sinomicrobium sp. M5D2P9]
MATKVFINLPVRNLDKSMDFFKGLGFCFNLQFTDEIAACIEVSDNIFVMLLTDSYFQTFTTKKLCDTTQAAEVLIALDANSRDEVKQIVSKARSLGGLIHAEPQDHDWMYQHSFADLDGHQWEFVYMDESQLPNQD